MLSLTSPVRTPYHDLDARTKLIALCIFTVVLFQIKQPALLAAFAALVSALYVAMGWRFFVSGMRKLKPLSIFVVVILVWHIATQDLLGGVAICLRLLAVVAFANLITMTTRLETLVDIATGLFTPLRRFGVRPKLLGFSVALVIRFIPVLMDRVRRLMEAWRARSARRVNWRILAPVFLTVLDDADHVAEALRARGGLNRYD